MKKLILLLTCSLGLIVSVYSQEIEWQNTIGGSSSDGLSAIQQTLDGGFIIGGQASSVDGDVTGFHGYLDYWIIKTDSTGKPVTDTSGILITDTSAREKIDTFTLKLSKDSLDAPVKYAAEDSAVVLVKEKKILQSSNEYSS